MRISLLISVVLFLGALALTPQARAIDASIVIDANSDTVISQENADRLLHPASMSKLMTLYLTFEALEQGRITLQRSFPVSAHAESMSPTKLGLTEGESIRVEDAILSLVTLSANDAAVVLAEGLGGSEDRFGQLMTRKAHQLGMVNTNFRNSNGLPDPAQISTARDMAILCRALIRRFPQYYHYFAVREFTYNGIEYSNHNHLMSRYEGMDGLKTGLTNASGFNLAASAVRNGRRLIGVVYGGTSAAQRDDYMAAILDEGFRRVGVVAMTTAPPPPIPGRKPTDASPSSPAGLAAAAAPSLPPEPEVIPSSIRNRAILAGQGDVGEPEDAKPAAGAQQIAMAGAARAPAAVRAGGGWGIQVGAYATRKATEEALRRAIRQAPELLRHATAVIAALRQKTGTVYRGRLTGLESTDAHKACKLLSHCMTLAPGES